MKLTVLQEEEFLKSIGYCSNLSYLGNEYEVYGIATFGLRKKLRHFLILIDSNFLCWCPESNYIKVTSDWNKEWVHIPNYVCYDKQEMCSTVFNDVYCYQWMVDEKSFFSDIIFKPEIATYIFKVKLGFIQI